MRTNFLKRFLTILFVLLPGILFAQGSLVSLFPNSGYPGQQLQVLVRGLGTDFRSASGVDFGAGITVKSVKVINAEMVYASIAIDPSASIGARDVQVRTSEGTVSMPGGFSIFMQKANVQATLNITPLQQISLGSLNRKHTEDELLYFQIGLFNDMSEREMTLTVSINGSSYGSLGVYTKKIAAQPGQALQLTNRDFEMNSSGRSSEIMQQALKMGTLPSDEYTISLSVSDNATGSELYHTEQRQLVIDPQQRPELIAPGNDFYAPLASSFEKQPLFQWYSQGDNFDFYLYKIEKGQSAPEEVSMNRPVYMVMGIKQTSLLYPVSAYLLRDDEVYAWQIIAHYEQGGSSVTLPSPLYRFKLKADNTPEATVSQIIVEPEEVSIPAGGTYHFKARLFNEQHQELPARPSWRVVPAEGGSIDDNGNFTAGHAEAPVAIIAQSGDAQEYILVHITPAEKNNKPVKQ